MRRVLSGVGIDLVNVARIRNFLKTHAGAKIRRLLSPSEQQYFKSKKKSPRVFARYFSAKEAFFKSLGKSWMGLEGFAAMEVQMLPAGKFKIKLRNETEEAEGRFFSFGSYVGAQVIR